MTLQNYFLAILFCISIGALVLAILAYTKKNKNGEKYNSCPAGMHYHPEHELADAITGCMLDTDM